jgi:hypothetical protein
LDHFIPGPSQARGGDALLLQTSSDSELASESDEGLGTAMAAVDLDADLDSDHSLGLFLTGSPL